MAKKNRKNDANSARSVQTNGVRNAEEATATLDSNEDISIETSSTVEPQTMMNTINTSNEAQNTTAQGQNVSQDYANEQLVVNQEALVQALLHLRSELAKVQNEKNELESEHTSLLEQLKSSKQSNGTADQNALLDELQSRLEETNNEKQALMKECDNLATELQNTRDDKQRLETEHEGIIAKVKVFADKVKSDMEELEKAREQVIDLAQQKQQLMKLVSELNVELEDVKGQCQILTRELEMSRSHSMKIDQQAAQELIQKDGLIQKLEDDLENVIREKGEWEMVAMQLRGSKDDMITCIKQLEREIEVLQSEKEAIKLEKDAESESLNNLQGVLEEFQAAKESEIREIVEGIERKLSITTTELSEYKERAIRAESELSQVKDEINRVQQYEKDIKEKNLLIGKLRHEAVILNEHLTEALRRMREESSENNVDRRLITNLLIAFFNTPRGDSKRFEILQLMGSVLHWTDEQKEQVGLIRKAPSTPRSSDERTSRWGSGLWTPTTERPRSRLSEDIPRTRAISAEIPRTDEGSKESFSDMWISFLLNEATKDNDHGRKSESANTENKAT
ncbi:3209_t:CDS:2 [Paraglomus brasilianum]|uniref:3209_t:CDS:1 n=1 Tax=Paraglomus brasilianum TaxID=144538 RepID=A0A9N9D6R8_9GLOM|nr:3209_t:CDS:2 [Paraglomus brasilianum]